MVLIRAPIAASLVMAVWRNVCGTTTASFKPAARTQRANGGPCFRRDRSWTARLGRSIPQDLPPSFCSLSRISVMPRVRGWRRQQPPFTRTRMEDRQWPQLLALARSFLSRCAPSVPEEDWTSGATDVALALNRMGHHSDALAAADRCIATARQSLDCRMQRGDALCAMGRL